MTKPIIALAEESDADSYTFRKGKGYTLDENGNLVECTAEEMERQARACADPDAPVVTGIDADRGIITVDRPTPYLHAGRSFVPNTTEPTRPVHNKASRRMLRKQAMDAAREERRRQRREARQSPGQPGEGHHARGADPSGVRRRG